MMNRLPKDLTRDEIKAGDLFIPKLDMIKNARPETAGLSRTYGSPICEH
jgi:hypothetical protein